jgi:ligand-binding sensor domain-containing protein
VDPRRSCTRAYPEAVIAKRDHGRLSGICELGGMDRSVLMLLVSVVIVACGPVGERAPVEAGTAPVAQVLMGRTVPGDGPITAYVRRILEDGRGHYWFGSNGEGVYRYDGENLVQFTVQEGLAGEQVTGIIEDRKGRVWIATDGGLSRYDPSDTTTATFVNYTTKDGLSADAVWSIYEARDGTIWAGTTAGACRYDGKAFMPFDMRVDGTMAERAPWVLCITEDRQGELYFGTDQGAFRTHGTTLERIPGAPVGADAMIPCILVDGQDRVWIGSMTGGITCSASGTTKRYTAPGSIGDNEVWTVFEDRAGHIWFSAEGHGVYRLANGELRNYGTAQGLGITAVQSIHEDRGGRLWFGGGGGLYRLQGDTVVEVRRVGPWR